jgi:hypothetical protein
VEYLEVKGCIETMETCRKKRYYNQQTLQAKEMREREREGIKHLAIRYTNLFKYVIP